MIEERPVRTNEVRSDLARRLADGASQLELEAHVAKLGLPEDERDALVLWVLAECSEPRPRARRVVVFEPLPAGVVRRIVAPDG